MSTITAEIRQSPSPRRGLMDTTKRWKNEPSFIVKMASESQNFSPLR
jgi:hypothetical protein